MASHAHIADQLRIRTQIMQVSHTVRVDRSFLLDVVKVFGTDRRDDGFVERLSVLFLDHGLCLGVHLYVCMCMCKYAGYG